MSEDKHEQQRELITSLFDADWNDTESEYCLKKECYREYWERMQWSLDDAFREACKAAYQAGYWEAAKKYDPEWME